MKQEFKDYQVDLEGYPKRMMCWDSDETGAREVLVLCKKTSYSIFPYLTILESGNDMMFMHAKELPAIPEFVECVETSNSDFSINMIYQTIDNKPLIGDFSIIDNDEDERRVELSGNLWKFKPSTKEAYEAQEKKRKEEELLAEAKRIGYLKGVKIKFGGYTGIIDGDLYWADGSQCVSVFCKNTNRSNQFFPLNYNGIWAEIIEEPKSILTLDGVEYSEDTLRSMIQKATS